MNIILLLMIIYDPQTQQSKMYVRPAYDHAMCQNIAKESEDYLYQVVPDIRTKRISFFCKPFADFKATAAELGG